MNAFGHVPLKDLVFYSPSTEGRIVLKNTDETYDHDVDLKGQQLKTSYCLIRLLT